MNLPDFLGRLVEEAKKGQAEKRSFVFMYTWDDYKGINEGEQGTVEEYYQHVNRKYNRVQRHAIVVCGYEYTTDFLKNDAFKGEYCHRLTIYDPNNYNPYKPNALEYRHIDISDDYTSFRYQDKRMQEMGEVILNDPISFVSKISITDWNSTALTP